MVANAKLRPGVSRERLALEQYHSAFKYFQAACHLTKMYGEYCGITSHRLAYAYAVKTSRAALRQETSYELWQECIKDALVQEAMVMDHIPPPRFIVQAWNLCGPKGGEAVALRPKKWGVFLKQRFFGDRQSVLFSQRGFHDRLRLNAINQTDELNEVLKASKASAAFHRAGGANLYLVEVQANIDAKFKSVVKALPLETQLTVVRRFEDVTKKISAIVVRGFRRPSTPVARPSRPRGHGNDVDVASPDWTHCPQ